MERERAGSWAIKRKEEGAWRMGSSMVLFPRSDLRSVEL